MFSRRLLYTVPMAALLSTGCAAPAYNYQSQAIPHTQPSSANTTVSKTSADTSSQKLPEIDIPATMFTLDNGLRVVVHEDRKVPVVAVNVWYHVGSKDEQLGRTGFAHLFEHLMFQGSENAPGEYFEPLETVGATDMNGTTNRDRTNYYQTVPTSALDLALFMESDRMGHFTSAITQKRLDEQREVVKNEKRQRVLNQPYGRVFPMSAELSYPPEHPYSWSTIGRMKDLDAATLEDVQTWFAEHYGAANAVVTIAGDISPEEARQKAEKFFGHIPSGPALARKGTWIAPMTGHRRHTLRDQVSQSRVYRIYNVPEWGQAELEQLRLATMILATGKNSRLYKRLVYEEQIATDVASFIYDGEIGSQFWVQASAKPGTPLAEVEAIIDEELNAFMENGPAPGELERVRAIYFSRVFSSLEKVGGSGKADFLASSTVFGGSPDAYKKKMTAFKEANAEDVRKTTRKWLTPGSVTLEVHPQTTFTTLSPQVDRTSLPVLEKSKDIALPKLQHATLSNGIKVVLQERNDSPIVRLKVLLNVGNAAMPAAQPGLAKMLLMMLERGTSTRSALEISAAFEDLGAQFTGSNQLDTTELNITSLKSVFPEALDILVDLVRNASMPPDELERVRQIMLAAIEREKLEPSAIGYRVLGPLLFGKDHAYGIPFTGYGYKEAIENIDAAGLKKLHADVIIPENIQIIAAGDIQLEELVAQLETELGDWKTTGKQQPIERYKVELRQKPEVVIVDRPGAAQSFIIAGHLLGTRDEFDPIHAELFNDIFGGSFTGRINMNLREDKGWTYGAYSQIMKTFGQQIMLVTTGVQSDKTAESLAEIHREFREIVAGRPPSALELARMKDQLTNSLPGYNESSANRLANTTYLVKFGLPDNYFAEYIHRIRQTELEAMLKIAPNLIQPERMLWIVVGDRAKIEEKIRALDLGTLSFVDADGNSL